MSDTPTMLQDRLAGMANEFSDEYRKLAVRVLAADIGKLERELDAANERIKQLEQALSVVCGGQVRPLASQQKSSASTR